MKKKGLLQSSGLGGDRLFFLYCVTCKNEHMLLHDLKKSKKISCEVC